MSTPVGIAVTRVTPNMSRIKAASCGETAITSAAARHMRRSQRNMRSACDFEIQLPQRIGRILGMTPPDHRLHVVLEEHALTETLRNSAREKESRRPQLSNCGFVQDAAICFRMAGEW